MNSFHSHVHLLALLVVEARREDEVVRVRARSVLLDDLANLHERGCKSEHSLIIYTIVYNIIDK